MKVHIMTKHGCGINTINVITSMLNANNIPTTFSWKENTNYEDNWDEYTHYIRWGCVTNLPRNSRGRLPHVINKSSSIKKASNKKDFRASFVENYYALPYYDHNNVRSIVYPAVVRPASHAFSNYIAVVNDVNELFSVLDGWGLGNDWYAAPYIPKDKEYRVMVMNGRVIYIDEKIPQDPNDITWDRPGKECILRNVPWSEWNMDVAMAGISGASHCGLDFCVVDVIRQEDSTFVLEVNTSPMLNYWDGARIGYNQRAAAEGFLYMLENDVKDNFECNPEMGWKGVIHPSRWSE